MLSHQLIELVSPYLYPMLGQKRLDHVIDLSYTYPWLNTADLHDL